MSDDINHIQFGGLSEADQKSYEKAWVAHGKGRNLKNQTKGRAEKIRTKIETHGIGPDGYADAERLHKAENLAGKLETGAKKIRGTDMSLEGAAGRRVEHFEAGMSRSQREGVSSGAGWYFEHGEEIKRSAEQHGFDPAAAITAASVQSPQNSPENERAATNELMRADAAGHLPKETSGMKAFMKRKSHPDVNMTELKRTSSSKEAAKALGILRSGETEGAIDPKGSPKVTGYEAASQKATTASYETSDSRTVPAGHGSDVHGEYMNRVGKVGDVMRGHVTPDQGQFDMYGLQESKQGILNPRGNTAEDTWMNTITHGHDPAAKAGDRTNVGKMVASDTSLGDPPHARAGSELGGNRRSAMKHAYNNEATVRAADTVSQNYGVTNTAGESMLPSVAMQETAWTEIRRVSDKDPAYTAEMKQRATNDKGTAEFQTLQGGRQHTPHGPVETGPSVPPAYNGPMPGDQPGSNPRLSRRIHNGTMET